MLMRTKKALLIVYAAFSVFIFYHAAIAQDSRDWQYFSEEKAKEIFAKKQIQIPCVCISDLLQKKDFAGVFIAIRDAALFGDKSCETYIKKHLRKLKKIDGVKDAVAFYSYKNGDPSALKLLAKSYDAEAQKVGDHWTVDLFGFINEWQISGRRLVRHAKCCSDGVGGETLCDAIAWRCELYGKEDFKYYWFKIGEEEKVSSEILQHFYGSCCQ
jgi:hypothetical protein